jgi:3-hydroxyacyl-CoA dehydrogenase
MGAKYRVEGDVAIVTLDNPPVNGMNLETRNAMVSAIDAGLAASDVRAIVIAGAGAAFSGGADIREFGTAKMIAAPNLHDLIELVEQADKPVIAAIHSVCIGGGLELSLACHYRIAAPGTQIGLPEVKLGLLPGAGGTQRLPRAVGLETALEMIVSGELVASEKLAATALFDRMTARGEDLLDAAIGFARQVADTRPLPKVRERAVTHADLDAFLQAARERVKAQAGPFPAPLLCFECVAASATMAFEDGLNVERELFMRLLESDESKALRHAFFAERGAAKVPDLPADTPLRLISRAAVIGAGTMGGGIAMTFANAGIPVQLLDTRPEGLEHGLATIRRNYEGAVKNGRLTPEQLERRMALITGTLSYQDIAGADIVIEAVFEDMAVKESVFRQLDAVMKPGAILASNTSTLDLNRIAAFTGRPQDVIGTHFFSPANVMKLLEVVRGAATSKDVLASVLALSKTLKKTGVVSGVCDGFIGNRMIEQYLRQAGFLLDEGALPQQVDRAIERFGFAMGPFRMSDLAGNDIGWAIRKRRATEPSAAAYSKTADLLCEMGRFGQKTGAGWYDYQAGDRHAYPSKLVEDMIVRHSAELGLARRAIDDEEIVERLVYALVNEGAQILEEGIALRAADIDVVYLMGYGFPLYRGGPMFYADTVGLPKVLEAIERYAAGYHGEAWQPAPLLRELAAEDGRFNR